MTFPSVTAGTVLFSLAFRQSPEWRAVSKRTWVLSLCLLATFVVLVYFRQVVGFSGFAQRVLYVFLLSWLFVTGRHLIVLADEQRRSA